MALLKSGSSGPAGAPTGAVASLAFALCSASFRAVVRALRSRRFWFSKARSPPAAERRRFRMGGEPFGAGAVPAVPEPGRPWPGGVRRALARSQSSFSRELAVKRSSRVRKANNASFRSSSIERGTGRPKVTNVSARSWVVGLGAGRSRPLPKKARYAARSASRRLSAARALRSSLRAAATVFKEAMMSLSCSLLGGSAAGGLAAGGGRCW